MNSHTDSKFEQVSLNFFFPNVFLCEGEPAENFAQRKRLMEVEK